MQTGPRMRSLRDMLRFVAGLFIGAGWLLALPLAADAVNRDVQTAASVVFVPVALLAAGVWWMHVRERRARTGLAGAMAGWLFIGSLALLGVAGSLWPLVVFALVASAIAYGVLLLVTQGGAPSPRQDLVTGLLLFATGGATVMFAVTSGLSQTDAWWMPAHWILAVGIGLATIVGARRMSAA